MFSIKNKIVLALILFIMIPMMLLGYFMLSLYKDSIISSERVKLREIADKKVDQIALYVDERLRNIRLLGISEKIIHDLKSFSHAYDTFGKTSPEYIKLDTAKKDYYNQFIITGDYYDFFLINAKGDIVFTVKHESDFGTNLYDGKYRNTGLAYVVKSAATLLEPDFSEYQMYEPSSEPAAFVATPLLDQGRLIGVVALQVSSRRFFDVITDSTGLGETGETVAAISEGDHAVFLSPLRRDPNATMKKRLPLDRTGDTVIPIFLALRGKRGS